MADILRVTSPVINKNIIQPDKALKDPSVPFDMQDICHYRIPFLISPSR